MTTQKTPRVVKMPAEHDVYVGRPSKWGNPFRVGRGPLGHTRDEAIRCYRDWLPTQPSLMAALPELRGKVLACWCAPLPCHADVLLSLANDAKEEKGEHE